MRTIDPDNETAVDDMNREEIIVLAFAHAEEARRLLNIGITGTVPASQAHAATAQAYALVAGLLTHESLGETKVVT